MTIITGELPKTSPYHLDKNSEDISLFGICSDEYIKTNLISNVSDKCKNEIIIDFIEHLTSDKNFMSNVSNIDFPIFDGKNITGNRNVCTVINKSLNEYIEKEIARNLL